jgi:hypothetical protein
VVDSWNGSGAWTFSTQERLHPTRFEQTMEIRFTVVETNVLQNQKLCSATDNRFEEFSNLSQITVPAFLCFLFRISTARRKRNSQISETENTKAINWVFSASYEVPGELLFLKYLEASQVPIPM